MQTLTSMAVESTTKRPVAISGLAALLSVAGSILSLAGLLAFALNTSVQVVCSPFHHTMSVLLNRWETGLVLLLLGLWTLWTGRNLWRLRRASLASAWSITGLLLVRGLLSLVPPIEPGDVTAAIVLITAAFLGMILLWRSSPAFKVVGRP